MPPRRAVAPFLLLAATLVLAACNHTPIGANVQTPFPSPTSASDAGRLIVEALGQTRYVSAEEFLASGLQSAMPNTELKSQWDVLATTYGKFKGVGTVTTAPNGENTDVSVQANFLCGLAVVTVTVDPTNKVTNLEIPTSGQVVAPAAPSGSGPAPTCPPGLAVPSAS